MSRQCAPPSKPPASSSSPRTAAAPACGCGSARTAARAGTDERRDQRRHTAVHEAGHAIVGRVLGLDCGAVTIVVNRRDMEAGHAVIADPMVTLARSDRIGRFRDNVERSVFRARIMAHMAGAEAEVALLGVCHGGDGSTGTRSPRA